MNDAATTPMTEVLTSVSETRPPQHPTPSRPMSAGGSAPERLKPPMRGDVVAALALMVAAVAFGWLVLQLSQAGIITFDSTIPLLATLNYTSLALTGTGFLWSLLKDLRWLNAEERDIKRLLSDPDVQRKPLLLLQTKGGKRRVETLLDDRVARAMVDADASTAPLRESELRAVAAWRSATLGSFGRYASGLLLLMTVLGTFVGVKHSMEPLSEALVKSASDGTQASALAQPLQVVAAAFGANLTALVGAIALGLAAWGLSIGRQNMLARLEQASSLYIYSRVKQRGPVEQLATAATQIGEAGKGLSEASRALGEVNATIRGELGEVRTALVDQLGSLSDSVGDFSASIDDSLKQTRQTLKALLEQQAVQVAEESRRTVDRLERQITDTTIAVQQATAVYGSIVGRLEGDVETVTTTVSSLRDSLVELREQREAFGRYTDSATKTIDSRLASLEKSTRRQLSVSRKTYEQYRSIDASMATLVDRVTEMAGSIAESERRRIEAQEQLHETTARRVVELLTPTMNDVQRSVSKLDRTLELLPGAFVKALEERPKLPGNGSQPTGADSRGLLDVLGRLGDTLQMMEERAARPLWRRMFSRR